MEKIFSVSKDFRWDNFDEFRNFTYYSELDEYSEEQASLDMDFVMLSGQLSYKVKLKFRNLSGFSIKCGEAYNRLSGFMILDKKPDGWRKTARYSVCSYEDDPISICCESIDVLDVCVI